MTLETAHALDLKTGQWSFIRIYRESWRIYRANFAALTLFVLCVYVPISAIQALAALAFPPTNPTGPTFVVKCFVVLLGFAGLLANIAVISITDQAARGQRPDWRATLTLARSRWDSLIVTSLIAG